MKQLQITILLTVLMSMFGAKAFAHDIEVANNDGITIYYKWINDKTELAVTYRGLSYHNYSDRYFGDVVIPESVDYEGNTYYVTSIGEAAFSGCSGLTSVTIPNSVTSIAGYAFPDCSELTSVTIPNSVTSIGEAAFRGCGGLTSVIIPNSVTSFGAEVFRNCIGLTSVIIPNSVTSISYSAFMGCSGLTTLTIGSGIETIRDYAQSIGCNNITLNVWDGNDAALNFYRNMGMKVQKTTMEIVLSK